MDNAPSCPVCDGTDWQLLGSRHYDRHAFPALRYERARHEVLFNVWLREAEDVELKTLACARCGLVIYTPRPDTADIRRKYEYLNSHETAQAEFGRDLPSDRRRSRELMAFLRPWLGDKPLTILDFGGGKGRLLHEFVASGHRCGVVDYVEEVIPGVAYFGRDLAALPAGPRFNLVICSHVIEHLADPLGAVAELVGVLEQGGHLYVEVPSEIWKRPPPVMDPVTHINFFTPASLRTLLETAGLQLSTCRYETFTRPNGQAGLAVKALGVRRPEMASSSVSYAGTAPLARLLAPSPLDRLLRVLRHPRLLGNIRH